MNAMERWASEQNKMMTELQGNMTLIQEGLLELKEKLKDPKKVDKKSEGSENSVNREERKERSIELGINLEEEEEERFKAWTRRVELPNFEGLDSHGWISRAKKFFEVQEVAAKDRLRLTFISMEGSANHWFKSWRQQTKNPTWEVFSEALIRIFGG